MRDDEYVDTDDEEGFICPPCVPEPKEPLPEDVARHNLTHIPYRSWCPHCVAARRNNQAHKQGSSAPRTIPLLVFDYAFIRDADTEDMLTILVGRHYPSRALFATVCDQKGPSDKITVDRLCQFFRSVGAKDVVFKSDQERSIVSLLNEVLRVSKLEGDPHFGSLNSAVPEKSAVGQSPSNSRAERSVQQVEDLVRTYKSAIEARMNAKLPSNHPLVHWLVEHSARTYNKYAVTPEGVTPYAYLHGKNPREKLVEMGEKVMWHVPTRLRAKLDLR